MAYQKKGCSGWYCAYREARTTKKREAGPFATKGEAEAWGLEYRAKKLRKDKASLPVVKGDRTFRDCTLDYFRERKRRSKREHIKDELATFNAYILPTVGDVALKRFSAAHLEKVERACKERGQAQNTIKRRMNTVKAILNYAVGKGWMPSVPRYRVAMGKDKVVLPPTRTEVDALVTAAKGYPHLQRFILLTYYTGARPGVAEVFALTWDDVDWHDEHIRVRSANKRGLPWRDVPINADFMPSLRMWHEQDGGKGPIIHYKGKAIKRRLLGAWWTTLERAGVRSELTPYSLRHAFVTNLIRAGVDMATVAYLAGHASPVITMQTYRHVQVQDTRAAVAKLQALRTIEAAQLRTIPEIEDKRLQ